jgi:hypothetical protein
MPKQQQSELSLDDDDPARAKGLLLPSYWLADVVQPRARFLRAHRAPSVPPKETEMTRKVIAVVIAAAFALPLAAQAQSGADRMFDALDKNKDDSLSREEVKGSPHDKDFTRLDKDNDGKLSRDEHAAAPEHAGDKPATGGTAGGASGSGSGTGGSSKKY